MKYIVVCSAVLGEVEAVKKIKKYIIIIIIIIIIIKVYYFSPSKIHKSLFIK